MPVSQGEFIFDTPRAVGEVLAGNGEVFRRESATEGVAGVHSSGAFMPTVAVGWGIDCRCLGPEGGELEEEVTVRGEGVSEVEGAGFFEEALAHGSGVEHGLAEGDVFHGERLVGIRGAPPMSIPEVLADLAHGFGGTSENLGGGVGSYRVSQCSERALGQPVVSLKKDEPFATGKKGPSIHGIVETAISTTVHNEVRERLRDLERSVGRATVHNEMLTLDPLPHRATNCVFECPRSVQRGCDDGEKRLYIRHGKILLVCEWIRSYTQPRLDAELENIQS